jgi:hypothetical protein
MAVLSSEKQTQTKPISISPQTCSGGLKILFEKTKPIWRKGKSKKAKGKMRENPEPK